MKLDKHDVVIQAVNALKNSQFKATAIKVELEAQLNRNNGEYGGGGDHECSECNGDWENATSCDSCSGSGGYILIEGEWSTVAYDSDNEEHQECDTCYGSGTESCNYCEEGYVECDGDCESSGEWSDEENCERWILDKLEPLGLAERGRVDGALKFARFYNDGSVDSEFTFTLSLKDPNNIFLLPKIIEVWNEFGSMVGNGVDVHGAGMHMALLNSSDCHYDRNDTPLQSQLERLANFKRSMQLLLPALYFLGSPDGNSRGLSYRSPGVGRGTHRAAIDYRAKALEFRIFDTCYEQPEVILDNVVVIANCMRYWTTAYKNPGMDKIVKGAAFGNDNSHKLERLYTTVTHIDLLNKGLKKLKPSYYTITELKQQRNFGISKPKLKSIAAEFKRGLTQEYREYLDRQEWNAKAQKHQSMYYMIQEAGFVSAEEQERTLAEIEVQAEMRIKALPPPEPIDKYIEKREREFNEQRQGRYSLAN